MPVITISDDENVIDQNVIYREMPLRKMSDDENVISKMSGDKHCIDKTARLIQASML